MDEIEKSGRDREEWNRERRVDEIEKSGIEREEWTR